MDDRRYRCPVTGMPDFCSGPTVLCPYCGQTHEAEPCGLGISAHDIESVDLSDFAPESERVANPNDRTHLYPSVLGDEINADFDWAIGQKPTSRSNRRDTYKAMGLNMYSANEFQQMHPSDGAKPGVGISYAGQKDHRSTSERGGAIKTADGRTVL